jgi:hypothetical protein
MIRFEGWAKGLALLTCLWAFTASAQDAASKKADTPSGEKATDKKASKADVKVTDEAKAKEETGEKMSIGASVSMGYSFNQMQFVECEGQDCGWQRLSVGMGVSYSPIKKLSLNSGLNAGKTLETSFVNAGTASRTSRIPWEVNDISLGASYSSFLVIPVVDIKFSGILGLGFPLSKMSRAAGLIMSVSPGVSMSWAAAGFSVSLGAGYSYFWNDDATVAIDCDRAPYNCVVSGDDTAIPNALHNIRGSFRMGYRFIKQLGISTSYSISRGMRSVEFETDERSSEYAQGGNQWSLERHSFSAGLSYSPFSKTSISLSMATGNSLYTADNKEVQLPFYDGSLRQAFRTSYSLGLSHRL